MKKTIECILFIFSIAKNSLRKVNPPKKKRISEHRYEANSGDLPFQLEKPAY